MIDYRKMKYLGLCNHVYLEGLWFATGHGGRGLYCIVPHDRIAEGAGGIILLDRTFLIRGRVRGQTEIMLWLQH